IYRRKIRHVAKGHHIVLIAVVGIRGQVRLAHYGDTLAGARGPTAIQSLDVVNGGEVVGRQKMLPGDLRGEIGMHDDTSRPGTKIIEARNPLDDSTESAGQGWLAVVGVVRVAVPSILMNPRAETGFPPSSGAAEADPGTAACHSDM